MIESVDIINKVNVNLVEKEPNVFFLTQMHVKNFYNIEAKALEDAKRVKNVQISIQECVIPQ